MPDLTSHPGNRDIRARGAGVTAVLGPTNTGKTHLAIERMLAHSSGIIGLPLRLLAREVYNKVAAQTGPQSVALITGEEKIKPPNPRFWVSTVEAMPQDLDVAFLAIDEIQLGADLERGHVFTDRMLRRRGREETLVLGAATMRGMVERLLPGANIVSRARLSQLAYAGEKKITRLPRRSAIVAFSADEVYSIAELIKRQRGGAAVVLGSLSPRTRNAQVALYQSGDVDYLIATDAIGMGLNLDVDHVAFASDRKFDGYQFRRLNPSELAQIAGRAGRATRDGTFGTTGRCAPLEPDLVQALESHNFEPVKILQWRNAALDFSSLGALQASLAATPQEQGLTRAPIGEDILVLEHAVRDEDVRSIATSKRTVERLWEVCQIPDYRKIAPATHAELVITLYGFLMREGSIPNDWFARQIAQADRTDGDIDTLSARIAHIRTWTFAANRPDWVADPEHWQDVTRAVEDKLSDALHERLTERFVDRRTSVLMRRLRENTMLETEINKSGEVIVEGHPIGRLEGFRFAADSSAAGPEAKALRAAAQKALAGEIDSRASRLQSASDDQFVLASDGTIRWTGEAVGKLTAGEDMLHPRVRIIADEQLTGAARDAAQARLDLWLKSHVEKLLGPLFALSGAEDVTGIARGIAFQLVEALGVLERHKVADEIKGLDQSSRATLRKYGVRFGAYHIYFPALLKPAPRMLATHLWALKQNESETKGLDEVPHLAASGRTSFPIDKDVSKALYRIVGYRVCGERAVRVDILERLADLIRPALAWRTGAPGEKTAGAVDGSCFLITGAMTSLTGSSGDDFASILRSLGYRMERRPKPQEPEAASVSAVSSEASSESQAAPPAAEVEAIGAETAPVEIAEQQTVEIPIEVPAEPAAQQESAPSSAESSVADAEASAVSAPAPQSEPELIEVWRPGRPPEERRHRPPRARHQHRPERDARPPHAAQGADSSSGAQTESPNQQSSQQSGQQKSEAAGAAHPSSQRPPRRHRPERDRGERAAQGKGQGKGRGDFKPREFGDRRERRDKAPDPNSPFAKLAALKAQLEADSKERR
ncbi:MAG TPA: helicase-related protein [Xanthobacteraceae bacterium]|nr:helicase-related protein [Xanthobacteraceae bacterium]